MSQRSQKWILVAIFAIMAAVQIGLTGRQSLWVDEIFSLAIATGHSLEHPAAAADPNLGDFVEPQQPVQAAELRHYLQHDSPPAGIGRVVRAVLLSDTSPPLYYILLNGWTRVIGTSDLSLRLFSVACSLACFPLIAGVARRTGGERTVIPACLLFALSPLGLYYSGEGRMYSLFLLCAVATAWATLELQQNGGRILLPAAWVVASAAGFLTHYFFLFPWLGVVIYLLIHPGAFGRRRLLACVFLTGLAILPWYVAAVASGDHWRITQGWLQMAPTEFHRFRAVRNHFLQFFSSSGAGLWNGRRLTWLMSVGLFGFVAAAMIWRLRLRIFTGPSLLVVLWFVLVCSAPSLIDLVRHTYFTNNPRYTFVALPAAYLLAAIGVCTLGRRTAFMVLILILLSWMPAIVSIYRQPSRSGESFREVAQTAGSTANASELVLVHSIPSGVLGIARYADGASSLACWIQQLGNRRMPESIEMLTAGRTKVSYILAHPLEEPRPEEDWLRANATVMRDEWVGRIKVVDFRLQHVASF
jgi:Dolichyl-phosphate-mannose-protein mannosyltransferase